MLRKTPTAYGVPFDLPIEKPPGSPARVLRSRSIIPMHHFRFALSAGAIVLPFIQGTLSAQVIATGNAHSIMVCSDGSVQNWGMNHHGQLGIDTTGDVNPLPVSPIGLTDVSAVTAGFWSSLFLKTDGSVLGSGWNGSGELGDGTFTAHHVPSPVAISDVRAIRAGSQHALALKNDSTLWAWGYNSNGQLGDGTSINSGIPVPVSGLSNVVAMAAGYRHSLAARSDGTVWAWGLNDHGQLGDGSTTDSPTPVQVQGLTGIVAVEASSHSSYAVKDDGTLWVWGSNSLGQLGDGSIIDHPLAVQLAGLSGITAISSTAAHVIALDENGSVWLWGNNNYGQLGDGTTTSSYSPAQLSVLSGISAIAAGAFHCLALQDDGTLWTWGYNVNGQLGNGTTDQSEVPIMAVGVCDLSTRLVDLSPEASLAVFPNPTRGQVTIETSGPSPILRVRIRNAMGQEILRSTLHHARSVLDLSSLPSGVYFLTTHLGGNVLERKLIKE